MSAPRAHVTVGEEPPRCLSALALDRLLAGEAVGGHASAEAHLEACASCRARLEEARAFKLGFDAQAGSLDDLVARGRPKRASVARVSWAMGALALAAAVALLLGRVRPPAGGGESYETRTKGHGRLGFFVQRAGSTTRGGPSEILHPGDAVEFEYRASTSGYLAVLSVDGAGRASVYYPNGPAAAPFAPGERTLETSTQLDGVLGPERWLALFCDRPVELEPVRARLAAEPSGPLEVPGCSLDRVLVEKKP